MHAGIAWGWEAGDRPPAQERPGRGGDPEAGVRRLWPAHNVGEWQGYSLYVGEAIPGWDKDARERLLRYCLRSALSLERLSLTRDGQVVYQVKATRRGRATQRIMSPMDFMARLVAGDEVGASFADIVRVHSNRWHALVVPQHSLWTVRVVR